MLWFRLSSFESSGGLSTLAVIIIRNSAITRIPVNIMKSNTYRA